MQGHSLSPATIYLHYWLFIIIFYMPIISNKQWPTNTIILLLTKGNISKKNFNRQIICKCVTLYNSWSFSWLLNESKIKLLKFSLFSKKTWDDKARFERKISEFFTCALEHTQTDRGAAITYYATTDTRNSVNENMDKSGEWNITSIYH